MKTPTKAFVSFVVCQLDEPFDVYISFIFCFQAHTDTPLLPRTHSPDPAGLGSTDPFLVNK